MRLRMRTAAVVALAMIAGCTESTTTPAAKRAAMLLRATALAAPPVRISEIHYDNASTDVGEAIEISGPAGTDVTGWSLVLYNGNGGAAYGTKTFSGTIPATCGARGVIVTTYAVNGIQNGDPDGVALVDNNGTVIELLSYGGTFTAVGGPANGMVTVDMGAKESSTTPVGYSLQRNGDGTWNPPAPNTFGTCNDDQGGVTPAPVESVTVSPATAAATVGQTAAFTATGLDGSNNPVAGATFTWGTSDATIATVDANGVATAVKAGTVDITATSNGHMGKATLTVSDATTPGLPAVRISEIHYDNAGTDANEGVEIEGPAGTDVTGWSIVLYNGNGGVPYNTTTLTGTIPSMCSGRGVIATLYPSNGIQNGGTSASPEADGMALVDATGKVIEFLSYEGVMTATSGPAAGTTSTDIGVLENSAPTGTSLQRLPDGTWQGPIAATMGACNGTTVPTQGAITFSGRSATDDPPLPVGFQAQIFATEKQGGSTVSTTFSWTSDTPAIATIDANGVITALAPGSAVLRATAQDGTTQTVTLPTITPVASTTALYANNTEFGVPTDADPSDDFIIKRPEYTISYSPVRNTPNWVAYEIDPTHFGSEDRCNCFTFDPALPSSFVRYTTADYTGAGAFAGYGIDRGHLARSADRTSASLDNAYTFYMSNIVPQASDLNQGPWAVMENYLGDLVRNSGKEVYVVAGVAGNKGTVKGEGKITIPAYTWKVAVIMPHDKGLADVKSLNDLQVVAAVMPNEAGVRNVDWNTYKVTVDSVEALSGYDLLSLLRDDIEIAVESNTKPPVAVVDGPYASSEGSAVSMSAAGSSDPDGDAITYAWSFGDGATATGVSATHTYANDGAYTVRLIATDIRGLSDTVFTQANVTNVAPAIAPFDGSTILPGETYTSSGTFTDPGADPWSATVDYGDGSGASALSLAGKSFYLSHTYTAAGSFTVTVGISDDDVTSTRSATVTVLTPVQGLGIASSAVSALVSNGAINSGNGKSLEAKLDAASAAIERGNVAAANGQLGALLNEIQAMVGSGRLSAADAQPIVEIVNRVVRSIGG